MDRDRTGDVLMLPPRGGRSYKMPAMKAIFKADEGETAQRYSISEWWLEPGCAGVGAHLHEENDEIFYVLTGTAEILTGTTWNSLPAGSFLRIPAGIMHDFRNMTEEPAGLLNIFLPGGFEHNMPAIVDWFASQPRT